MVIVAGKTQDSKLVNTCMHLKFSVCLDCVEVKNDLRGLIWKNCFENRFAGIWFGYPEKARTTKFLLKCKFFMNRNLSMAFLHWYIAAGIVKTSSASAAVSIITDFKFGQVEFTYFLIVLLETTYYFKCDNKKVL
jgi:hypothetical protein